MKFLLAIVLLFLVFSFTQTGFAQDEGKQIDVKFAKGKTNVTYRDSVVRGTTNTYYFSAKAGQKLTVVLTPVYKNNPPAFGVYSVKSKTTLSQPSEQTVKTTLPDTGEYILDVAPANGSTDYKLLISIR